MLKRILRWVRPRSSQPDQGPTHAVYSSQQHSIASHHISRNAINVIEQLQAAGFQAFLVGGGVRDLLLQQHPKDFDIATDATPEEAKGLFRGARIIGRRFRIVHVRMGREIIEVTTFRGDHSKADEADKAAVSRSDEGMLLRDNVFGSVEEDALRRDFSINALYYNPTTENIYDYAGGVDDLAHRLVRMIGEPAVRYQEDPVRMLRAVRFASKLSFEIHEDSARPITELNHLLGNIPAARLFDEVTKLLMSGHGVATFQQLRDFGLFAQLFPATAPLLDEPFFLAFLEQALINTDERIRSGKRVTPAFLFAALLWPAMCQRRAQLEAEGLHPMSALQQAMNDVIAWQVKRTAIPRRFSMPMREIWELQERLPRRQGRRAASAYEHPRFRAGYDFVLLREQAGEELDGLGDWWTRYQEVTDDEREKMVQSLNRGGSGRKRRRRRKKPTGGASASRSDSRADD